MTGGERHAYRVAAAVAREHARYYRARAEEETGRAKDVWGDRADAAEAIAHSLAYHGPRKIVTVEIAGCVIDGVNIISGAYTLEVPARYDPAAITAVDLVYDDQIERMEP